MICYSYYDNPDHVSLRPYLRHRVYALEANRLTLFIHNRQDRCYTRSRHLHFLGRCLGR